MNEPRKVLVAGAAGALGRAFVERLQGRCPIVPLGHLELDITRRNDVFDAIRQHRPDLVINAAAVSDIDVCEVDRWQAYLTNRDGAKHLAMACAEVGCLLVYPSSDLIFDGSKQTPYREEDPPNPLSIYGDTKLAAELAVMSHAPQHLVVRTGWLFGPYGRSYVTDLLEWRETREVVLGADDQRSQPTYQLDFVDAVLELVRRGRTGLWHAAAEGEATQFEVAQATYDILKVTKVDVKPLRRGSGGRAALRPRYSVLDC
ncbi:MAG TPA: NAD(P)-dependent oxidoreductase, partial [Planctomycetota bacterium]|nr:NAD(P)-dependent oxidoreductase [Planctomycetota bacterium]